MTDDQRLRGIFAPTLTPLLDDLSPDPERYIAHSKDLLARGCHGLCPFGTTSEANSFSISERTMLLEALVDGGIDPAVLMPGTGMCAIPDTVALTRHAVELGCGGVLMLPPFFYKGMSDEGIYRAFAETIARIGDDRLRIYLYHIPQVSQVPFSFSLIERLRSDFPETIVGIKDSSGDWTNLHGLLTNFPGFGIFTGSEKFVWKNLQHGGVGAINAVANVIPERLRPLYEGWDSEQAEQMQEDVLVIMRARGEYAPIPVLKQIVAKRLNDPTWLNLRPPLTQLSDAEAEHLLKNLRKEMSI